MKVDIKDIKNMIGRCYGNWIVLEYIGKDKHSHHKLLCQCRCEKQTVRKVNKNDLAKGKTKSCGKCNHKDTSEGDAFGKWTVLEIIDKNYALCQCNCKNKTIRNVSLNSLKQNKSTSCGCSFIVEINQRINNWLVLCYKGVNKNNQKQWLCECQCESKTKTVLTTGQLSSGYPKDCGCTKNKNIYDLSNKYGIGYTHNKEPFYFDLEDYNLIKNYNWTKNNRGYIVNGKTLMHRLIMNPPLSMIVDHINRNKIDNRKENLRVCNYNINNRNKRKLDSNTSGTIGVTYDISRDKWMAHIRVDSKFINLGRFDNIDDAIYTRKKAEIDLHNGVRYPDKDEIV